MHLCLFSFATVAHAKLYMTSLYVNISTSVLSYSFADNSWIYHSTFPDVCSVEEDLFFSVEEDSLGSGAESSGVSGDKTYPSPHP